MTSENLPFYELTDAELCWLLNDNAVENINSNSDFSEFIKASKAKVINDEMRFKYMLLKINSIAALAVIIITLN